jgi:adenylate cyclase
MNTQDFKRKLTAVFSADVAGYSRLMGEDEAATVKTLESYKQIMFSLIKQHRGRVIDSPGDNLLAEFPSVVDAVQCGVAVQKELQARNAELPENRKMQFRIGINLGDVIEEGDRIYGDGVNIAARLEALADPGGICVSKTAFDHIEAKLPLGYHFLGEQTVKNIAKPVGAYKVLMEPRVTGAETKGEAKKVTIWHRKRVLAGGVAVLIVIIGVAVWEFYCRAPKIEPASKEKMAFELPDKPSIAVLPFVNISEDSKQEYLSDGITDQIIAGLSRIEKLFVIARNSTFTYKSKPVKVQQVAEELGVRYVLEGSVQKSGDKIRITTQLDDALKGDHLWSERYDRPMKDIFALQDEITIKVVEALRIKLGATDIRRPSGKGTQNLEAFLKFVQGFDYYIRFTPDALTQAARYFQEAIDLDPNYAAPHALMSMSLTQSLWLGASKSPKESIEAATRFAEKARELDESYPMGYLALGQIELTKGQFDKAISYYERGLALDPNNIGLLSSLGSASLRDGRWEEAILHFKRAIRLNPLDPTLALWGLGAVYCRMGRYEEAIPPLKQALRNRPQQMLLTHLDLAACYAGLGKEEEARAAAAEVLKMNPKFTVEEFTKVFPIKDDAIRERYLENLRKAGIPEKPPLPLPDKPSIAVLSFVNLSDDKDQEYFSDGLTEEIITALSKIPRLFVIARNSSFVYKGKAVNVQQVGRELGVKYVVEGSVRRSGDRLRITAQLIDASNGNHLWGDRYDREMKDVFAIQDEITMRIMIAMQVKLTEGEQARLYGKGTKNLDAYLKLLQGRQYLAGTNRENIALAQQVLREAIALDPKYAEAYTQLAGSYFAESTSAGPSMASMARKNSLARAREIAEKAVSLDDSDANPHSILGLVLAAAGEHEEGVAEGRKAVALNPNSADAHARLGIAFLLSAKWEEAIASFQQALRLNPNPPVWCLFSMSGSYSNAGRHDEAIATGKQAVYREPDNILAWIFLTMAYGRAGRGKESQDAAREILRINPQFCIGAAARQTFHPGGVEALRNAGLPVCSPEPRP